MLCNINIWQCATFQLNSIKISKITQIFGSILKRNGQDSFIFFCGAFSKGKKYAADTNQFGILQSILQFFTAALMPEVFTFYQL